MTDGIRCMCLALQSNASRMSGRHLFLYQWIGMSGPPAYMSCQQGYNFERIYTCCSVVFFLSDRGVAHVETLATFRYTHAVTFSPTDSRLLKLLNDGEMSISWRICMWACRLCHVLCTANASGTLRQCGIDPPISSNLSSSGSFCPSIVR